MRDKQTIAVVSVIEQRCRKWSVFKVAVLGRQTYKPTMSTLIVARHYDVGVGQLFNWDELDWKGALTPVKSRDSMVPASELTGASSKIFQRERLQGKKTTENVLLKRAVDVARDKKGVMPAFAG